MPTRKPDYKIHAKDWKGLSEILDTTEQMEEVSTYLEVHKVHISRNWKYSSVRAKEGRESIIEGAKLGDGFESIKDLLIDHVRNYRGNLNIKKTPDYKLYKKLEKQFKHIK